METYAQAMKEGKSKISAFMQSHNIGETIPIEIETKEVVGMGFEKVGTEVRRVEGLKNARFIIKKTGNGARDFVVETGYPTK